MGSKKIRSFGQILGRFKSIWSCVNCQPLSVHPRHSKYKLCAANNLWTPQTPHFGSMTQLITAHTQRHQSNEIQRTTDKWTDGDKQIPLMVITHNFTTRFRLMTEIPGLAKHILDIFIEKRVHSLKSLSLYGCRRRCMEEVRV